MFLVSEGSLLLASREDMIMVTRKGGRLDQGIYISMVESPRFQNRYTF